MARSGGVPSENTGNSCSTLTSGDLPVISSHSGTAVRRSGHVRIDGHAPLLKQPFRNVASIPIALAPHSKMIRRCVALLVQPQALGLEFKFRRRSRSRLHTPSTTPVGISFSASHRSQCRLCQINIVIRGDAVFVRLGLGRPRRSQ